MKRKNIDEGLRRFERQVQQANRRAGKPPAASKVSRRVNDAIRKAAGR